MGVTVHHEIHYGRVAALLYSPGGAVARDMLRRGVRVASQARRNLAGANGQPRRIDTGATRASIYTRPVMTSGGPGARVGATTWYAILIHSGTGIYGPRHRMIRPRKAGGYLVFTPKGGRGKVFVRQVRGMKPNPFLVDALSAARG